MDFVYGHIFDDWSTYLSLAQETINNHLEYENIEVDYKAVKIGNKV